MSRRTIINLTILILALIVAFVAYRAFLSKRKDADSSQVGLVASSEIETDRVAAADEFLGILLSLQQIELRDDLFREPLFRSLKDFSKPLRPQIPGRVNPFAPIGVGGRPSSDEQSTGTGTTTQEQS